MNNKILVTALAIVVLAWPRNAAAQCSAFSGQATVAQVNVLGSVPVVVSNTGSLNPAGDAIQTSLLDASVPGLLSGGDLHATSVGLGSTSRSEASVSNLVLNVAGYTIGADFVMSRANAVCGSAGTTVSGIAEIDNLVVNGQSIAVTGLLNQTVPLLGGGLIVVNEQTGSGNGSITVNALHFTMPAVADAVIASSSAGATSAASGLLTTPSRFVSESSVGVRPFVVGGPGGCDPVNDPINCLPPPGVTGVPCDLFTNDFVTGGGRFTDLINIGDKDTFGVGGGCKKGQLWGHLEFHDHDKGLNIHGTEVTNYLIFPGTCAREIQGNARLSTGQDPFYVVDVVDNGEPGNRDVFKIQLFNSFAEFQGGMTLPFYTAAGVLSGGNIQLHNGNIPPC